MHYCECLPTHGSRVKIWSVTSVDPRPRRRSASTVAACPDCCLTPDKAVVDGISKQASAFSRARFHDSARKELCPRPVSCGPACQGPKRRAGHNLRPRDETDILSMSRNLILVGLRQRKIVLVLQIRLDREGQLQTLRYTVRRDCRPADPRPMAMDLLFWLRSR